jgi:hypothetical protein
MGKWTLIIFMLISTAGIRQVNLQTGAAEAGFPLFQYNDAKTRLSMGVSLNYVSGSGLRVNDVASNVGTGWELMAGGFISRLQHGEPDDQKYTNGFTSSFQDMVAMGTTVDFFYPDGYLYTNTSPQNAIPGEACYSPVFVRTTPEYKQNFDDREQDVFVFQFNGRQGQFVIDKDHTVKVLNDSKLLITFDEVDMQAQSIRTKINSATSVQNWRANC